MLLFYWPVFLTARRCLLHHKVSLRTSFAVATASMIHPEVLMSSAGERPNGEGSWSAGDAVHRERKKKASTLESDEETSGIEGGGVTMLFLVALGFTVSLDS